MRYESWAPHYARIRAEFGFPFDREVAAERTLATLLPKAAKRDALDRIAARLKGRDAIVVGLAPRAGPPPIWKLPSQAPSPALLAADGATTNCLDAGLVPAVITTDLDGPVASEVAANRRGSLVVIHAHGDNLGILRQWVHQFPGELAGSWAGPPRDGLLNVGGFTDGDRAAYLADHVGATRILLWGFEFERTDETDPIARARKLAKLRWARDLIGLLAREGSAPTFLWRPDGSLEPYLTGISVASTR